MVRWGFQDAGDADVPESDFMRGFKVAAYEFKDDPKPGGSHCLHADSLGVTAFLTASWHA